MKRPLSANVLPAILVLLIGLALVLPAQTEEKPAAEKPAAKEEPKEKPSKKPKPKEEPKEEPKEKEEPDPFKVPDGTPDDLLKFLEGLQKMGPDGIRTRDQFTQFLNKRSTAVAEAADKVLAGKPTDAQFLTAAKAKLEALATLGMLNSPTAETRLAEFVEQLKKLGKTDLAREGRSIVLKGRVRSLGGADAAKKFLADVKEFLSESPPTMSDASLMMTVAQELEYGASPELALDAYRSFADIAAKSSNERVAKLAERFAGVVRRLELPGKPIRIEGVTMDGKEFEWEKFRQGKVVLIDFWATWCGWCIREIPETKTLYEAYRDRGFEIVGISGDRARKPLEDFLQKTPLPWTVLYGKDGPSPTIEHYGVSAWPTMLLVDKDGKVVSLRARGQALRDELKRLLGPMEEKGEKKDEPGANPDKPEPKT